MVDCGGWVVVFERMVSSSSLAVWMMWRRV